MGNFFEKPFDVIFEFPYEEMLDIKMLHAHKYLLSKDSKYFEDLFNDVNNKDEIEIESDEYEVYQYYLQTLYNIKFTHKDWKYDFAERLVLFQDKINSICLEKHIRSLYPLFPNNKFSNGSLPEYKYDRMICLIAAEMNLMTKTPTMVLQSIARINILVRYDCSKSIKYMTTFANWILFNQLGNENKDLLKHIMNFVLSNSDEYIKDCSQEIWDVLLYISIKYDMLQDILVSNYLSDKTKNTNIFDHIKKFNIETIKSFAGFDGSLFHVITKIKYYSKDNIANIIDGESKFIDKCKTKTKVS